MNRHSGLDLVERAKALAPLIAREADKIERTRRLTPAVTQALIVMVTHPPPAIKTSRRGAAASRRRAPEIERGLRWPPG